MKTFLDCIPCLLGQALAAAQKSTDNEMIHRRVINSVSLMIPDLALDATPAEIAQQVYRIVYEITGNSDPYAEAKEIANQSAMTLYTRMKDMVHFSENALETACKLAIAGNAINIGSDTESNRIQSAMEDSIGYQLDQEQYQKFKENVGQSYLILYIADKAGEIVFDRILIEQLLQVKKLKIVLVVREKSVTNEATMDHAYQVGLDEAAMIITNGSAAPATILSQCSTKMQGYYRAADIIISKGQANYESLRDRTENIYFLFKVMCSVIAKDSGHDIDSPVLISSRAIENATPNDTSSGDSASGGII